MMEKKFRAWDKANKQMLVPLSGIAWGKAFIPTDYIQGLFDYTKHDNYTYVFEGEMMIVDDCEIMQFIDRLDQSGKEIYEGDIVTCEGFGGSYQVVKDGCCFVGKQIESTQTIDLEMQEVKIIGNIYEDPHLIIEKS